MRSTSQNVACRAGNETITVSFKSRGTHNVCGEVQKTKQAARALRCGTSGGNLKILVGMQAITEVAEITEQAVGSMMLTIFLSCSTGLGCVA